jgi:hypothetical protein
VPKNEDLYIHAPIFRHGVKQGQIYPLPSQRFKAVIMKSDIVYDYEPAASTTRGGGRGSCSGVSFEEIIISPLNKRPQPLRKPVHVSISYLFKINIFQWVVLVSRLLFQEWSLSSQHFYIHIFSSDPHIQASLTSTVQNNITWPTWITKLWFHNLYRIYKTRDIIWPCICMNVMSFSGCGSFHVSSQVADLCTITSHLKVGGVP